MGTTGKKQGKSTVKFGVSYTVDKDKEEKKEEQNQGQTQGSENSENNPDLVKGPSNDENDVKGVTVFGSGSHDAVKWFDNPKMSNHKDWSENLLTHDEKEAVTDYTGSWYMKVNPDLYNKKWDDMDNTTKEGAANLYSAINKFELNKTIKTVRRCDFKIFGQAFGKMTVEQVKDYIKNQTDGGLIQINGFLSSTTKPMGTFAYSTGVWLDIETPPNKGGCAYVSKVGYNMSESEVVHNSNSVFKFDADSVKMGDDGKIHVSCKWVGQAKDQAFKKKK